MAESDATARATAAAAAYDLYPGQKHVDESLGGGDGLRYTIERNDLRETTLTGKLLAEYH